MKGTRAALVAAMLVTSTQNSEAQPAYPTKPVRIVVPSSAGGGTDIIARIVAPKLTQSLGQQIIVDDRPGAGTMIGGEIVAKSAPDGYTIVLGNSGALSVGVTLFPNLGYQTLRDLAPITMIADSTVAMVVHPSVPANNLHELVALAKQRDPPMTIAIASVGSIHHLLIEQFKLDAKVKLTNIPYKGGGQALIDLIAGTIDINMDNVPALIGYIRAGQMRAVAVASAQRSDVLPQVPTVVEEGYPGLVASPWFAMMAPAKTPRPIVERLNRELVAIMRSDDMKQRLQAAGANPMWSTPEECGTFIAAEIDRWARVIRESGAKIE